MRRLASLVSRLTGACRETVTLRAMAQVAAKGLVEHFPDASVVVFEHEEDGVSARAIAGANIPDSWRMRRVRLADVPIIAEALSNTKRLIIRNANRATSGSAPGDGSGGTTIAICGAVPDESVPVYVVLFMAPFDSSEQPVREAAIDIVRDILAAIIAVAGGAAVAARRIANIHQGKTEWERAADALPEILGMLDARGRILRINLTLESWGLSELRHALNSDLHEALHTHCDDPGCALRKGITDGLLLAAGTSGSQFELRDELLARDIIVTMRSLHEPRESASGVPHDAPLASRNVAFTISDVSALRKAEYDLRALNRSLEDRVEHRTAELTTTNTALRSEVTRRSEAETSLRASHRELEDLSEQLMNAQELERKRVAEDLHDSVGQSLVAMKYSLEHVHVLLQRDQGAEANGLLAATITRAQNVIDEVRAIAMNLRPAVLDNLGAASAVRYLCREWHDVYRGIAIATDISVDDRDVPPVLSINLFRAIQESLNNVARHSAATSVRVTVELNDGVLLATVHDDGVGFRMAETASGRPERHGCHGLRGLRERAARAGGRCRVISAPGAGTTVRIEWPLGAASAARSDNPGRRDVLRLN